MTKSWNQKEIKIIHCFEPTELNAQMGSTEYRNFFICHLFVPLSASHFVNDTAQ